MTGDFVRRRRKCNACGSRWSTYEVRDEVFLAFRETRRAVTLIQEALANLAGARDAVEEIAKPGRLHRLFFDRAFSQEDVA